MNYMRIALYFVPDPSEINYDYCYKPTRQPFTVNGFDQMPFDETKK